MNIFKKLMRLLTLRFLECVECEKYSKCDKKPWIHRVEEDCNYGKINGK